MHYKNSFAFVPEGGRKFKRHRVKLVLGRTYLVRVLSNKVRILKFIKVTPKGFNFIDESTSKCAFKSHFYDRNYVGKKIPRKETEFNVGLHPWIREIRDFQASETA